MSLYMPDGETGFMHSEAPELDRKLREGDGIHWTGDPRLELRMGIIKANRYAVNPLTGRYVRPGAIIARRYEVWRHCEDGTDQIVGHWRLEDFDRILLDLAPLRMDSPGHVDALDAIDKHNEAIEKENSRKFKESAMEALSHMLDVHVEREHGKTRFRQMPGLRDASSTPESGAGESDTAESSE